MSPQDVGPSRAKKGFLDPHIVRTLAFWTTTACILVSAVACVLAIWEFTGTDVLWRTAATAAVIAAGTIVFSMMNGAFGEAGE
jgi:membrane protein YdbS with pleckstrin-like domain